MRLVSLIILLVVVGGVAYVLIFKRDWLFEKADEGLRLAQGYKPAQTPAEAMDYFRKAVKDRDYKTAATYCTADYAEQLVKAHDAAREIGGFIDKRSNYMKEKGLNTGTSTALFYGLDPFPGNFKVKIPPKTEGGKTIGVYELELMGGNEKVELNPTLGIDFKMMQHCLAPFVLVTASGRGNIAPIELVKEGTGEAKAWKLKIEVPPGQVVFINYFLEHYKTYVTGLEGFSPTRERYTNPKEFEGKLIEVLVAAGKK